MKNSKRGSMKRKNVQMLMCGLVFLLALTNSCRHNKIYELGCESANPKLDSINDDKGGRVYDVTSICNQIYLDVPDKGKVVCDSVRYTFNSTYPYRKDFFNDLTLLNEAPFNRIFASNDSLYGTLVKRITLLKSYNLDHGSGNLYASFYCYSLYKNNGLPILIKEEYSAINNLLKIVNRECLYPTATAQALGGNNKLSEPDGIYVKKMVFINCGCSDYCASTFIDSTGVAYNYGNLSNLNVRFDCNLYPEKADGNIGKVFAVKYKKQNNQLQLLSIERNTAPTNTMPDGGNNSISSGTKDFNEIQMNLTDGSIKKAKLYLGNPDFYQSPFGDISKGFLVYKNRVSNSGGTAKHLVLFVRGNGFIEDIYSIEDNQKVCFGIHCLKIVNGDVYSNTPNCKVCKGNI